ncbi:MAG: oligopeptide transporter, OPT family, partial [Gemmataceae bacterium]|nr:oligopeptide transporter, OPT family [Gemmataceae bacterium]
MSSPTSTPPHQPYVSDEQQIPEFTWPAVVVGAVLGIIFGASSLYLVLKVGMTVSASVPIAVLSITLFRLFSWAFGFRRATILENNIVQTTGSAGESIAFGVGVTMPALLLLGWEMDLVRVMTVAVLGGLLGILMMIPLRRAFIVKQHGELKYPEGTACAEVLVVGEKGGATALMVFLGFGIALIHKFLTAASKLWPAEPSERLYSTSSDGTRTGLKGAELSGELAPELLGVGYLIGPRIASLMMGGAVLSYFVLGPLIAGFGEGATAPVSPEKSVLIRDMEPGQIKGAYLRYIGAGAVAAGGIISMCRALPLILGSIVAGLRDLRSGQGSRGTARTEQDLSMGVVVFGSLGLVALLAAIPAMGLGLSLAGILGAVMVLLFGFLFVTVSSRLTGEVGSSSNPISGMTIATLLLTCAIFYVLGFRITEDDASVTLTVLSIAAVVCVASSNGGTTSQDLKTGFLVGATPRKQQWAILVGSLTSALVIGGTMLLLDAAGTHYTAKNLPERTLTIPPGAARQKVGRPYDDKDANWYYVVHVRSEETKKYPDVKPGRYLVDDHGRIKYKTDTPIAQQSKKMDNGADAPKGFTAPQPQLFESIIRGILGGTLEWSLFIIGILIALTMELAGVRSLPFAVGMYIPLGASTPIFAGGLLRWLTDRLRGTAATEVETETSPGVLLSSGYIAGGTLCGLIIAFFTFLPGEF